MKDGGSVNFDWTEKAFIHLNWWKHDDLRGFFVDGVVPEIGDKVEIVCSSKSSEPDRSDMHHLTFKLRVVR